MSITLTKRCADFLETNCYILTTDAYALVIDPALSYDELRDVIGERKLAVALTHGHYDHFTELPSYQGRALQYFMSSACAQHLENSLWNCAVYFDVNFNYPAPPNTTLLGDGDKLIWGDITGVVSYNPGHTNSCLTYFIDKYAFTGDFLFANSIGRSDLATSEPRNYPGSLAKVFTWDPKLTICPGHGPCDLLENQWKTNPYLQNIKAKR